MILVRAGLGKDLDAAIADAVVLRGEWILVDADLTNRRLGGELAAGEAVYIDLSAVRPCRGTGQRGKLTGQLIRIVRERFQILALDDGGTGIGIWINRQGQRIRVDVDDHLLLTDLQLGVDREAGYSGNLQVLYRV